MSGVTRTHFFDYKEDRRLGDRNIHFWRAIAAHVEADRSAVPGGTLLDIGCHHGGLLELLHERLKPSKLIGLERLMSARRGASERLARFSTEVQILDAEGWSQIPDESVDLVFGHEVLQYIKDLPWLMAEVRRVLAPRRFAYMVLGCHSENPLWVDWKRQLEEIGHTVYDHAPLDLMLTGSRLGLAPSVRPLRDSGWSYYDPGASEAFSYPSVAALLDHQFRHKLLFRFERCE